MAFYDEYAYDEYSSSKNPFAMASLILGGIAIISFSSAYSAVFMGSLSIIFAFLSRKGTNRLHPLAKVGAICSSISLVLGSIILVYSLIHIPEYLKNDGYRSQLSHTLESIYGPDFDTDGFLDSLSNGSLFGFPENFGTQNSETK